MSGNCNHTFRVSCDDLRYRWASCQLDSLRRCLVRDIPDTLKKLPPTLNETYERMLNNIDERKRKFAHYIFQLLTVSRRPLSVQELAEVFAIRKDKEAAGILNFEASLREPDAEMAVRSVCSSLISIDDINGEKQVRFSHFTVQEFLTSNQLEGPYSTYRVLPWAAHIFSAKLCLGILLKLNNRIAKDNIRVIFPLAAYAAKHWVDHAKAISKITTARATRVARIARSSRPSGPSNVLVYFRVLVLLLFVSGSRNEKHSLFLKDFLFWQPPPLRQNTCLRKW